jgi:ectoine hydroxylase-related dioxygenase (phytanoyl-CoA dioxygenase family)
VVWELNEVEYGSGGTVLLSGSHKMNFARPKSIGRHHPLFETYSCPPGSVLIFSEAVCHAGVNWTNPKHPRTAFFNCFGRIDTQYHKLSLPAEVIRSMPERRQTLFRGVWDHDFVRGVPNDYFSEENMSV